MCLISGIFAASRDTRLFTSSKDDSSGDFDATILNASYTFGGVGKAKSAKLYLEHEAHELDASDKTTAGVLLKF